MESLPVSTAPLSHPRDPSDGGRGGAPDRPPQQMSRAAIGLFGVIALFAGLLVAYFGIWPTHRMKQWSPAICTIQHSAISSAAGDNGTMYSLDLEYTYEVKGHPYMGTRYTYLRSSSSWRFTWEALVRRLTPGTQVPCFYDPSAPTQVVLSRALSDGWLLWAVALVFAGVGLFLLRLGLLGTLTDEPGT